MTVAGVVGIATALPATAAANPTTAGGDSPERGFAYVPMYYDNTVERIDLASGRVTDRIPVGIKPIVVKYSSHSKKLYVGNFGIANANDPATKGFVESYVSVVDPATKREITKIPTSGPPYAVSQMSEDGRSLYVPTALSVTDVIDTATNRVVRTIPVVLPPQPAHVEISRDDKILYSYASSGTVTGYDTKTGAIVRPPIQTVGAFPGWGAQSLSGDTLYVINYFGGISTIDTRTWRVTRDAGRPLTTAPLSATITPDGRQIWMANIGARTVEVMDVATGDVVRTTTLPNPVTYVGFSADGATAYLSDMGRGVNPAFNLFGVGFLMQVSVPPRKPGNILVYDTATYSQQRVVPVGSVPVAGVY